MGTKIMIKELKKLCFCFFICILFCLSCKTEVTKYIQLEPEHTSIVWKGSFASADEIENPQYLWAYYNTTDGCSYIYDGEKWTLLASAGKNGADGLDGQNGTDGSNGTNGKNARVVILYVLNGGILPEGAPSIYSYGTPVELEEPVFEPYKFEGFYYNADFSGKKVTSLDDDYAYGKVLYARWGYRITFDDNYTGGESNTLEYYDIDSVNNSFNTPVRTGYTFLGWYNNPNYDEKIDCWNTNENKGNVTLYAKWKISEYTITYVTLYGDCPEPVKVEYNTVLDETYFPVLSDWDYFCFNGWKANGVPVGPNYVVTNYTVFYADYILKEGFRFSDCRFQDNSHFNGSVSTRLDLDYLAYKDELPSVNIYLDSFYFGSGTVYFDSLEIGSHPCPQAKDWYDQFYYELEHYLCGYTYGRDHYRNSFIFESGATCHPNNCWALDRFEAGNYKCYAIASLQGHKYLVPISDSEKLILIDEESVDPDSIPEGYYYDVTLP